MRREPGSPEATVVRLGTGDVSWRRVWMCGSPGPAPSLVSVGFCWTLGYEVSHLSTVDLSLSLLWETNSSLT